MSGHREDETLKLFELLMYAMDGVITDAQFVRLERLLSDEPEAVEYYVRCIMIDAAMNQSKDGLITSLPSASGRIPACDQNLLLDSTEQEQKDAAERATEEAAWQADTRKETIREAAKAAFEEFKAEEQRRQQELAYKQYRVQRRRLVCFSACPMIILAIFILTWIQGLKSQSPPPATSPVAAPAPLMPEPQAVATITNTYNARDKHSQALMEGTELVPGLLQLETGAVEITFTNEAVTIFEAPAEVNIVDERLVCLRLGTLTAHVPPSAKGFRVETPSVHVTDLGTHFGVIVDECGVTDVHVMNGCIAASFIDPDRDVRGRIKTLYTNDAMRFDADAGTVGTIEADTHQLPSSWDDFLYRPRIIGALKFEQTVPVVRFENAFESDNHATLWLERRAVMLPRDISVDIAAPGHYQKLDGPPETIRGGHPVDSYLIQWNPVSQIGAHKKISGQVIFKRPILGLIVRKEALIAGNVLFGRPGIDFPSRRSGGSLGLEFGEKGNADTVTLSQDRQTLSITLRAGAWAVALDQIRIFVSAAVSEESMEKNPK